MSDEKTIIQGKGRDDAIADLIIGVDKSKSRDEIKQAETSDSKPLKGK